VMRFMTPPSGGAGKKQVYAAIQIKQFNTECYMFINK